MARVKQTKPDNAHVLFIMFAVFFVALAILTALAFSGCTPVESDPVSVTVPFAYTATGDDGMMGQANQTEIRMAQTSDSLINNWNACQIISDHFPWASGIKDTILVTFNAETGVPYFFALKIADEVPNWSLLSNIITRTFPDTDAPLAVTDFDFGN